jgi:hypothetical protein
MPDYKEYYYANRDLVLAKARAKHADKYNSDPEYRAGILEKNRISARKRYAECKDSDSFKEKRRNNSKKVYKKRKELYCTLFVSKCCQNCGDTRFYVLEWHHRDPSQKEFALSQFLTGKVTWEQVLEEVKKCDVLCSNCHRELHYNLNLEE